jgi:PA14 domain
VLLTKTNNEHNDAIYNFSYPAHWAYSGMGPAYKNINAVYTSLIAKKGKLFTATGTLFDMPQYFESGDEIAAECQDGAIGIALGDPCGETEMTPTESGFSCKRLWVINGAKAREVNPGYYLIDRNGKYYTGNINWLRIIRSGKRNMQAVSVGSITSLNNPIQNISGKNRFVFDANTGVVGSSAAKFKDVWPVENRLKQVDSCVTVIKNDSVKLIPKILLQKLFRYKVGRSGTQDYPSTEYYDKMISSFQGIDPNSGYRREYKTRSLLKFNFPVLPAGSTVTSAKINLYGMIPAKLWDHAPWNAGNPPFNYSYDGLSEPIDGILSRYRVMGWDGSNTNANWDYDNNVDNRTKTQINHVPIVGMQNFKDVDVTPLITEILPLSTDQQGIEFRLRQDYKETGQSNNQVKFMSFDSSSFRFDKFERRILTIKYQYPVMQCFKKCVSDLDGKDTINPYIYGIWGNWRGDRAYTYYNDRKESDPTIPTNIRKDGQILNFAPYWSFATNNYLSPSTDESRWVWNSEIKMLNRKGFDIENRDPLNRYNAGIYGFRQHLPIAVAQNSKQREIAYDGFEDYDYNTDTCIKCALPLWIDHKVVGGQRIENTAHTGKFSLKLIGNQTVTVPVTVVTPAQDSLVPNISIANDTVFFNRTVITPNGTGLATQYWNTYPVEGTHTNGPVTNIDHDWGLSGPFFNPTPVDNFKVEFKGKIQPKFTGSYTITLLHDDGVRLYINDVEIKAGILAPQWLHGGYRENRFEGISFVAGQTYRIKVLYREDDGTAAIKMLWSSSLQRKETIPQNCLYPTYDNTVPAGSITTISNIACIKPKHPKPENLVLPKFAPINGTSLVLSAWVREEQLCLDKYNNVQITVVFNDGAVTTKNCKPSGNIIEGWQRIEETINVPATGTIMNIQLKSLNNTIVYFDDIRFHPFNSNMKSFVYNPINLRLMAELDENNYASFYEYDDDGTLIRVKKETERGVKTIQETRSALIKE